MMRSVTIEEAEAIIEGNPMIARASFDDAASADAFLQSMQDHEVTTALGCMHITIPERPDQVFLYIEDALERHEALYVERALLEEVSAMGKAVSAVQLHFSVQEMLAMSIREVWVNVTNGLKIAFGKADRILDSITEDAGNIRVKDIENALEPYLQSEREDVRQLAQEHLATFSDHGSRVSMTFNEYYGLQNVEEGRIKRFYLSHSTTRSGEDVLPVSSAVTMTNMEIMELLIEQAGGGHGFQRFEMLQAECAAQAAGEWQYSVTKDQSLGDDRPLGK